MATIFSLRARERFAYCQLPIVRVWKFGGSSFTKATKRIVRAGRSRAMRRASASIAATPLALSSAPGASSTVS